MKTYLLKLSGLETNLQLAKVFALRYFSSFKIESGVAHVTWICETGTIEDVMDDINMSELERWDVNVEFLG